MKPVIREIAAKTILNRSKAGGYSLNCYIGCRHGCIYCYARYMQRFHPHEQAWGDFVDVKVNAVEVLHRQLRRAEPGQVFVSSACDAYQPEESRRGLTRRCAQLLMERGFQVNILTKSTLVLRDLDMYAGYGRARIGVTVTTPDETLARLWEPRAALPGRRFEVLRAARQMGLATSVMFGPLLPGVSDDADTIELLFAKAALLEVDAIWTDALNPRPKVWPAIRDMLSRERHSLVSLYRKALFEKAWRESYLRSLRDRITAAARAADVADRLAGCP